MPRNVHFVGIGGIGLSALARYYRASGARVSGSDSARSEITDDLRREGVPVAIGHRAGNVKQPELIIYSAAVQNNNPELKEARRKHIPMETYAEALGKLTKKYFTIAVAGSHGKSTTTALIGLILTEAGLDPTVIVGTKLREFGGSNFRAGKSQYLVIEADEWNRSFHHYYPQIAVITNIDREHLDTYKTYSGVKAGFAKFLKNLPPDGVAVINYRNIGARKIAERFRGKVIFYNKKSFPRHSLWIPGAYNQTNAEAAWQVAKYLKIKKSVAEAVFRSYRGAWRRLEQLATNNLQLTTKAIIYSDYAHHPTEIKATLAALREKYPKKKIIAVFQPHLADRLNSLFKEFASAFRDADKVIIVPVYKVAGRHTKRSKNSLDLARAIVKPPAFYAKDFAAAKKMLCDDFHSRSIIVAMSAGDLDAEVRKW